MIEKTVNIKVKEDGADEVSKKVNKLNTSLGTLESKNDDVKSSMDRSQQSVLDNGGAMGLLNDATGGVAMTIKDAVEATALFAKESKIGMAVTKAYTFVMGTSTGAMKAFKIALIGTGIGAIVVGIGLLIANFDKVKKAVMNFIPGLSLVGDFFGKIVNAVTDFIGVTSELSRELDKLSKASEKMLTDNKDLLANFGDQLDSFQKKQIEIANSLAERLKEIKDREGLSDEQRIDLTRKAQERAKRDLLKNIDDTNAEAAKKRQEERDKINAENQKAKEEAFNLANEKYYAKKALEEKLAEDERKRKEDGNKAIAEINAENEAVEIEREDARLAKLLETRTKEVEIEKTVAQAKADIQDATLNNISAGIGLLKQIAGKNKGLQAAAIIAESAMGIAKIVINTQAANAAVTAKYALIPGGAALAAVEKTLNKVGAGIGIASNLLATKTALGALGQGGGGGSAPAMGGASSAPAPPQFNIVGQNSNNQLAQSIGRQQSLPIEAFVVSGAVTSAQAMDRNRVKTATFN